MSAIAIVTYQSSTYHWILCIPLNGLSQSILVLSAQKWNFYRFFHCDTSINYILLALHGLSSQKLSEIVANTDQFCLNFPNHKSFLTYRCLGNLPTVNSKKRNILLHTSAQFWCTIDNLIVIAGYSPVFHRQPAQPQSLGKQGDNFGGEIDFIYEILFANYLSVR